MKQIITDHILQSYTIKKNILENNQIINKIEEIALVCVNAYKNGKKTIFIGNGGSAADAQHLAGELVGKFYFDRKPLPSLALSTNSSIVTAVGNDYGYNEVFKRQIEAHAATGDVLLCFSTSGNSENILKAIEKAKVMGIVTIGFTGQNGGTMSELCDYLIQVPSETTPLIQESHIMIGHIICGLIEKQLFG